jgi:hypothetical protein
VRRKFTSLDVIEVLSELFITRGLPKHIRSEWSRVHIKSDSAMVEQSRGWPIIYRTGQSLGEWLQ